MPHLQEDETQTSVALDRLGAWIEALPVVIPGTDEHRYVVDYTKEYLTKVLCWNGKAVPGKDLSAKDQLSLMGVREAARHRIPEVILDTSHPLHAPEVVQALERDPIVDLIPPGWLRLYYLYARGGYSPVQYSFACSLTVLGAWVGRRAWHNRQGRYTIYPPTSCILISTIPGLGKGTALKAAQRVLRGAEYPFLAPDRITGSKLLSFLSEQSRKDRYNPAETVVMSHEMSGFFSETGATQKGSVSRLIVDLTELFDMPESFSSSTQIRDTEAIIQPTLSGIFCSNLDWAADNMPRNAFGGGFLPRQTICVQTPEDLPKLPAGITDLPPPPGIFDLVVSNLVGLRGICGSVGMTMATSRRFEGVNSRINTRILGETDDRVIAYLKRLPVNALRMAMIFAISQQRVVIEEDDLDRALRIQRLFERNYGYLYERVGVGTYGYSRQVIFHVIRRATRSRGGISEAKLKRAIAHLGLRQRDYNEVINDLMTSGMVDYGDCGGRRGGRLFMGFRAKRVRRHRKVDRGQDSRDLTVDDVIGTVKGGMVDEENDHMTLYTSGVNLDDLDDAEVEEGGQENVGGGEGEAAEEGKIPGGADRAPRKEGSEQ